MVLSHRRGSELREAGLAPAAAEAADQFVDRH